MTFEKAKEKIIRCSGTKIRRPCWKDRSLRITGDKQFAGEGLPYGKEDYLAKNWEIYTEDNSTSRKMAKIKKIVK